ncbi:lysylphosphatidylglycerol synthase domain-containing protein [Teredinibacter turnerae]|uniref:lysylphosphatidylglycerol synthase domain-containing protein n=1 Tax=Teredinibacter turnerae TaxID=2426 RepID=UPI00035E1495|nr:lysylphosphatidylglycerol synthase domain-containing protein [Teredinibacter turnerae]
MTVLAKASHSVSHMKNKIPWGTLKKVASGLFFLLVAYLLVSKARELEWNKIWSTFRETDTATLWLATVIGMACYLAYASYDLIGRKLFDVEIPAYKTVLAAWISYACNLNLGAIIGSVALRYRLYSRLGVKPSTVTKIMGVSVFSNWAGYVMLAGGLFVTGAFEPPESWAVGDIGFRLLGGVFLALVATYVGVCAFANQRTYRLRDREFTLPELKIVAWQLTTAAVHWTLMATVIYQFFQGDLDFTTVYIALLVSCVAGAVSHVPGGLGVLEAVFVALLAGELPRHEILAGVFAYRCVFYFVPLAFTLPLYGIFETVLAKKSDASTAQ